MSSHHIVRENQEPALLIVDAEEIDMDLLGQLLEWSPTILTDENNLDFLLAWGIKVDVVFGTQGVQRSQEAILQVPLETSLLDAALSYLCQNNFKAVNIIANDLPDQLDRHVGDINLVVIQQGRKFSFVQKIYEKWKPKDEIVYVDEKYLKSFQGLIYVAHRTFRTAEEGFIILEFNTDTFVWVGEDI